MRKLHLPRIRKQRPASRGPRVVDRKQRSPLGTCVPQPTTPGSLLFTFCLLGTALYLFFTPLSLPAGDLLQEGKDAYKKKQYQLALEKFNQAAKKNPKSAEAQYHLGLTYARLGQYESALEAYKKAQQLDPKITFTKPERFKERFSEAEAKVKQGEGKEEDAEEADRSPLPKPRGGSKEGEAGTGLKSAPPPGPTPALQEGVLNLPPTPTPLPALQEGRAAYEQGDYKQALEKLLQAAQMAPHSAEIQYNLGLTYFKLGKFAEAVQAYEKARQLDPELTFTDPVKFEEGFIEAQLKLRAPNLQFAPSEKLGTPPAPSSAPESQEVPSPSENLKTPTSPSNPENPQGFYGDPVLDKAAQQIQSLIQSRQKGILDLAGTLSNSDKEKLAMVVTEAASKGFQLIYAIVDGNRSVPTEAFANKLRDLIPSPTIILIVSSKEGAFVAAKEGDNPYLPKEEIQVITQRVAPVFRSSGVAAGLEQLGREILNQVREDKPLEIGPRTILLTVLISVLGILGVSKMGRRAYLRSKFNEKSKWAMDLLMEKESRLDPLTYNQYLENYTRILEKGNYKDQTDLDSLIKALEKIE